MIDLSSVRHCDFVMCIYGDSWSLITSMLRQNWIYIFTLLYDIYTNNQQFSIFWEWAKWAEHLDHGRQMRQIHWYVCISSAVLIGKRFAATFQSALTSRLKANFTKLRSKHSYGSETTRNLARIQRITGKSSVVPWIRMVVQDPSQLSHLIQG